uniref:Uncharacterized protein n=1 Tax=viral metagenome TaxID=1070528 RepID=A0A6C0J8A8_9ZZZZ
MSLTIEGLTKLLESDDAQLNYIRLDAKDLIDDVMKPENITMKIQIPSYFRDIFSTGFSIHIDTPSGISMSIWHCLLYIMTHERYTLANWEQKKLYVEKFIQELDQKILLRYYKNSIIIRNTRYIPEDLKLRAKFITDDVLFALSSCLKINILVLGTCTWNFHYGDPVINMSLPLIILNKDHRQCYSVVSINNERIFDSNNIVNQSLKSRTPDKNVFLLSILKDKKIKNDADIEFIRIVKGQSIIEMNEILYNKQLNKLKMAELKIHASENDIDITSISGRLTKAKLIDLLIKNNKLTE